MLPTSIHSIVQEGTTAMLFSKSWALYDAHQEKTILIDNLTDWCAFNNINAEQLIIDSHQGLLHLDRYQVYTV